MNVTQAGFGLFRVSEQNKISSKDCVLMSCKPLRTTMLMKEARINIVYLPFSYYKSKNKQENIQREKLIKGVP